MLDIGQGGVRGLCDLGSGRRSVHLRDRSRQGVVGVRGDDLDPLQSQLPSGRRGANYRETCRGDREETRLRTRRDRQAQGREVRLY